MEDRVMHICNYKGKRVLLSGVDFEEGTFNIVFNYKVEDLEKDLTKAQEAYLINKIGKIFNQLVKEGIEDEFK